MKKLAMILASLATSVLGAKTIDVAVGDSIADAVAAAEAGDIVQLAAGMHEIGANITVSKAVTVRGGGVELTTVKPTKTGITLFELSDAGAVLSDVTLAGASTGTSGAAVNISAGTLRDAVVTGNAQTATGNNGILYLKGDDTAVRRCRIVNNTSKAYGGGIFISSGSPVIESCLVATNTSTWGGGIYNDSKGTPLIAQCAFHGNTASSSANSQEIYNYNTSSPLSVRLYNCFFAQDVTIKSVPTKMGCVAGGSGDEESLKGNGVSTVELEKLERVDINGRRFKSVGPSVGCIEFAAGNKLDVTGIPIECGEPTPPYGTLNGCIPGQVIHCVAPAAWTNDEETAVATCGGWTLLLDGLVADDGDENTYDLTYPTEDVSVELQWRWNEEFRVTVEPTAIPGCSVSPMELWARPGQSVTLTADVDELHGVSHWEGVDGEQKGLAFTFVMPHEPVTVKPVFSASWFVAVDGSDEASGEDSEHPLATIAAAVAKIAELQCAATIVVGPGEYDMQSGFSLDTGSPLRLISEAGAERTVFVRTKVVGNQTSLTLNHLKSTIEGFTFTQRAPNGEKVMAIEKGTVSHCIFSNLTYTAGISVHEGGVLRDTLVCENHQSGNDATIGIYGGLVERCRIVRNMGDHYNYGESVGFYGGGGVVRNCLIADNTNRSDHAAGVYFYADGLVENSTIANNVTLGQSAVAGVHTASKNATLRNSIVYGNRNASGLCEMNERICEACACTATMPGEGNLTVSSVDFADPAAGDYRVLSGPTIDSAEELDWMRTATDLAGESRIIGDKPDMGCYEYRPAGLRVSVTASSTRALGTGDFTLTATASGAYLDGLVYGWTVSCGGETVATGDGNVLRLTDLGVGNYDVALTVRNGVGDKFVYEDGHGMLTVCPLTVYVAKDSHPAPPYASWETAAPDLSTALETQMDGMTFLVGPGVYTNRSSSVIGSAVTVTGVAGSEKTVLVRAAKGHQILQIGSKGARVSGLTLTQGERVEEQGGIALTMTSGTFADSAVIGCWTTTEDSIAVVKTADSLVTNTVFSGNYAKGRLSILTLSNGAKLVGCRVVGNETSDKTYGAAIFMENTPLVRNCLVACNTNHSGNAAGITYRSGVIENSTIVSNHTLLNDYGGAAGIDHENGYPLTIRNCIVRWNFTPNGETNIGSKVTNDKKPISVDHTLTEPVWSVGEGNIGGDPKFANHRNYRLLLSSPGVNCGQNADWMTGTVDLIGNPRINEDVVDMGCTESVPSGLRLLVR